MKPDIDIFDKAKCGDGMTVPDGYFANFAAKMENMLPPTDFEASADEPAKSPITAQPTRWQKTRPYIYMAAMFAGAWCMLKMFSILSPGAGGGISFDNDPVIAEAISNDQFIDEYFLDDYNQYDLYQDIMDEAESSYSDSSLVADTIMP